MRLTERARIQLSTSLFLKAAGIHVQTLDYRAVRRYLRLDGAEEPFEVDDSLGEWMRPDSPALIQGMLQGLNSLCRGGIMAHESVRVLFRSVARDLNPRLLIAHHLGAPSRRGAAGASHSGTAVCGALTVCNFVQDEALHTNGVEQALRRRGEQVDLDRALLIDIVCSKDQSGAGRALLGQLLCHMLRAPRGRSRRDVLCAVAVSASGLRLLTSFGFQSIKLRGSEHFVWLKIDEASADTVRQALAFEGQASLMGMCVRPGLTRASQSNMYLNGC